MNQDELQFERECRAAARRAGWIACKLEKNGHKGIPDDLFISPDGRVFLIEFKKSAKERPRREQVFWLEKYPSLCHLVGDKNTFFEKTGIKP